MEFPRDSFIQLTKSSPENYKKATIEYADNLAKKGFPVIYSLNHLAVLLNEDYLTLCRIVDRPSGFYAYYLIKKKRGGKRRIVIPFANLKLIQRWILDEILSKVEVHPQCMGFVAGRSTLNNAKPHIGKAYIRKFDFKDFFESIGFSRVRTIFMKIGYSPAVSFDLARLCTLQLCKEKYDYMPSWKKEWFSQLYYVNQPILAQGAPTSPAIANIVCRRLDKRFDGYARSKGIVYTRYADDLTFSSDDPANLPKSAFVRRVVEEQGLRLNSKKIGTFGKNSRQMVTGILIDGDKPHVSQQFRREIYRHLHFCKKFGVEQHFAVVSPGKDNIREWLYGKIRYVQAIDPDEAKKMYAKADKLDWGLL